MAYKIKRRNAISLVAAGVCAAVSQRSFSAPPPKDVPPPTDAASIKPYDEIVPPVKSDVNRVRFFFSYSCPHCRSYHNGIMQWGASLPRQLSFDAIPIITDVDDDSLSIAVLGRLIGQAVSPSSLEAYDYAMYANLQGDPETGIRPLAKLTVKDALRTLVKAGADPKAIQNYLGGKGKGIENRLPAYASIIKTYNIKVTPSISLVGKYIVNPDHAQGNPQQFLLLLNGLVSRIIQGGRNAL
jgi:thiol:disulfide interchange protein DsbA